MVRDGDQSQADHSGGTGSHAKEDSRNSQYPSQGQN